MQIRELGLKELLMAYEVVSQLRTALSYDEFEDLIYEMIKSDYKMFGILDGEELVSYAGVAIGTNLYHKRHLFVFDLVVSREYQNKKYGTMMLEYLNDYAKMGMCEKIVLSSGFEKTNAHRFYENNGFVKKSFVFVRSV